MVRLCVRESRYGLQPGGFCFVCLIRGDDHFVPSLEMDSIRAWISSAFQNVAPPCFTGLGYLPDLTPAHHVDFETGNEDRIVGILTNPA
jgi:hypothetical protein